MLGNPQNGRLCLEGAWGRSMHRGLSLDVRAVLEIRHIVTVVGQTGTKPENSPRLEVGSWGAQLS
jgi:hypothetical protein